MLAQAAPALQAPHDVRSLLAVLPLAAVTVLAYGRWVKLLAARGGRVSTAQAGPPDLIFTVGFGLLFSFMAALGFLIKEQPPLTLKLLMADAALKLVMMAVLGTFLAVREVNMVSLFGLREVPPLKILGYGVLFLLAALPIMGAFGMVIEYFSGKPEEQNIVSYFRDQVKHGQIAGIAAVFVTASIMAPITEELVFRGYFYPTLKRYLGPIGSAVLVSLLFSAFHGNVAALLPLFVLALCLTIAYEWTGSLLVPMTMHAIFNTTSLAVMCWQALHGK